MRLVPRAGAGILSLFLATICSADPQGASTTNSFPWEGDLVGTNVYVRTGPGTNYYPATKLDSGHRVLVLGEKFGWYEIAPPRGCFSYIDMAAVDRAPGSQQGKVKQDKTYVRAGSDLVQSKTSTQVVLDRGATVTILGEADGFFKIAPPHGASLYVSKQYVQMTPANSRTGMVEKHRSPQNASSAAPVSANAGQGEKTDGNPGASNGVAAVTESLQGNAQQKTQSIPKPANDPGTTNGTVDDMSQEMDDSVASDGSPVKPSVATGDSNTSPAGQNASNANRPATAKSSKKTGKDQPSDVVKGGAGKYQALLETVESDLKAEQRKTRDQQNLEPLVERYQEIALQDAEQVPAEVAKIRMGQIRDWLSIRGTYKEVNAIAEDIDTYRSRMSAERMKIMRARAEQTLIKFDLEGELRKSYVFNEEGKRRFRLVDPQRQTTIAYVDVPPELDSKVDFLIGRLVGIRVSGQHFDSTARVPIAMAASITDLSDQTGQATEVDASREMTDVPQRTAQKHVEVMPPPLDRRTTAAPSEEDDSVNTEPETSDHQ